MGMFDVDMSAVQTSNQPYGYTSLPMQLAYAGAGGMVSGVGKMLGFQDEEDMLKEIHENADYSTMEGRKAAISKIMAINPTKGKELSEQLNQVAQAEAATTKLELANENALLERAVGTFGPELELKFQNDVTVHGERAAIHLWLRKNEIPFDESITTTAQAAEAIQAFSGAGSASIKNDMYKYVQARQASYVKREAYKIAGITLEAETGESASIDTTMADLSTPTPKGDAQLFHKEGENYNANDSNWTNAWKKVGGAIELVQGLHLTSKKLFNINIEMLLPQDKLAEENAQDAVQQWIGGALTPGLNEAVIMNSPAYSWFKSHKPIHFKEFQKDPVKYYKKHRKEIENSADYSGGAMLAGARVDNTDLFASIPY